MNECVCECMRNFVVRMVSIRSSGGVSEWEWHSFARTLAHSKNIWIQLSFALFTHNNRYCAGFLCSKEEKNPAPNILHSYTYAPTAKHSLKSFTQTISLEFTQYTYASAFHTHIHIRFTHSLSLTYACNHTHHTYTHSVWVCVWRMRRMRTKGDWVCNYI